MNTVPTSASSTMTDYVDFRDRIHPDWPRYLADILARARSLGPRGVLAFDLDSTLFDNRPRQARIVREYGKAHGQPLLERCQPAHFTSGWDLRAAMVGTGMTRADAERLHPELKRFWAERFFTSEYCADDEAIEGAAEFLDEVVRTGAVLVYLTGRHEEMRAGTVEAMRKCRMVLPDPARHVHLLMKPTLLENDDAFKRHAHLELGKIGTVIAAFDNEPTHANDYRSKFPEATVIHLATDHSGRPVQLLDGVLSVPHFRRAGP